MKNKRIIIVLIAAVYCSLVMSGCYDDKGNYKYHEVNTLTITIPQDTYDVISGVPIDIIPVIESNLDPEHKGDYEYNWYKFLPGKDEFSDLETHTRELRNWIPPLFAGEHTIFLEVTDKNTGVSFVSPPVYLNLRYHTFQGFLVLSETGNLGKVELLSLFDGQVFRDEAIGLPELVEPLEIHYYRDMDSPYIGHELSPTVSGAIAVIAKSGAYKLHPADLYYDEKMDIYGQILGRLPAGAYIESLCSTPTKAEGYALLRTSDGDLMLYMRAPMASPWTVGVNLNSNFLGVPYNCSPHFAMFDMMGMSINFNTDTKSFMYNSAMSTFCFEFADPQLSNTGKDLLFLETKYQEGTTMNPWYAVMKDEGVDNGKRYLISANNMGGPVFNYDMSAATEITDAVEIAVTVNNHPGKASYLFYRTDEKIYLFDYSNNLTRLVYTVPAGMKISFMKNISGGAYEDNLMLATYDPSKPGSGVFEVYITSSDGRGTMTLGEYELQDGTEMKMRWEGFGRIVSSDFKLQ